MLFNKPSGPHQDVRWHALAKLQCHRPGAFPDWATRILSTVFPGFDMHHTAWTSWCTKSCIAPTWPTSRSYTPLAGPIVSAAHSSLYHPAWRTNALLLRANAARSCGPPVYSPARGKLALGGCRFPASMGPQQGVGRRGQEFPSSVRTPVGRAAGQRLARGSPASALVARSGSWHLCLLFASLFLSCSEFPCA